MVMKGGGSKGSVRLAVLYLLPEFICPRYLLDGSIEQECYTLG